MDFDFSDDQYALRDTVRRFLGDKAPLAYVRSMFDDPRGTTDAVWRGLADLGVTGMLVDAGMTDMALVLEELGRAVHPGPFQSSAVGAVSAVAALAPGDELLAGLADGTTIGALALYEPAARYDWRAPSTRADGGDRLTGSKAFVPDAVAADVLLVGALDADGALAVFAVDAGAEGLTVEPQETSDPTRKHGNVTMQGAPGRRLGQRERDRAADVAAPMAAVVDRVGVAAVLDGVGAAQAALDMTIEYAKTRVQFDKPIGSFQAVQHHCADMLQAVEMARSGAYYAAWAADAAAPEEAHRAATMAMAFAAEALPRVGATAIQVHGGIGFTWEHDIHLFYKRLLTLAQAQGTAADHLEELAALVL
ncbi:MAG: acyl-CoA dehydrogenase protein [Acidimicrobiales bacterium]|jgi:alkylation response protein AidB-like acyl-CoA dehydrogenase|nr:acyl-CoA dehydrogenase protein [Acidimicrobiales bacterium]